MVVGASAGGIEALRRLCAGLPPGLPAAVLVVLHVSPRSPSLLAEVLGRNAGLPVRAARDGEDILPGRVYVAPPDRHLLVAGGRLSLTQGPRENWHRPAIDPLFRSAARLGGPRVAGIVLSGSLDDGTAGLAAVKACGGVAIVQTPEEALFPDMPLNAIRSVDVDHCLPVAGIAELLSRLAGEAVEDGRPPCREVEAIQAEMEAGMTVDEVRRKLGKIGAPASIRCPECSGPIWEIDDPRVLRYRCEVGHAFTAQSLESGQAELVERALWSAVSALEEKAAVSRRISDRSRTQHLDAIAELHEGRARRAEAEAENIRRALRGALSRTAPRTASGGSGGAPPGRRCRQRAKRSGR